MLGTVLGLLFCAYTLWAWNVYIKGNKGLKQPPFMTWVMPFIGHVHILFGNGVKLWESLKYATAKTAELGGVTRFVIGANVYYVITDPEDALTAANACLQKHYSYEYASDWLGEGLITGSGEVWKRHRRLLTPAFGLPVIYSFLGVFNSQARKLVKNMRADTSPRIDQTAHLRRFSLETFCLTAFGIDSLENENFVDTYMKSVDQLLSIITRRFQNFWLQSDILFKLSGYKKQFDDLLQVVNDMSNELMQKKKADKNNLNTVRTSGARSYKVFLDLLLELSGENALTDKEIREEVDTAIAAGFDTTSGLLSFVLVLIGSHPDVQEKMYNEIKEVIQTDRDVESTDLSKLVYMEAVIKESLCYYTTVPVTLRRVDKNVELKNCTMRAGTQCIIILLGANQHYQNGEDKWLFRPERWLGEDQRPIPTYFPGFSLGKRSCLGKFYAMTSMKTTLVHLLRHYKVKSDGTNLRIQLDFVIKPRSGHEITLEERL